MYTSGFESWLAHGLVYVLGFCALFCLLTKRTAALAVLLLAIAYLMLFKFEGPSAQAADASAAQTAP